MDAGASRRIRHVGPLEHRHAANAERAAAGCRRQAGDSSRYRARRTGAAPSSPPSAAPSSLREVMSSLPKTLWRWYSTVRGLMNSRAPISGLERPSRASRAIWASRARELIRRSDGAFAGGLAGGLQLARGALGERLDAHRREHLVRGAQLLAGVQAPLLAAQPFAVEEMGASELGADPRAGEPLDRLAVEALGGLAVAEQRPRAGLDPQRPVGAAGARRLREPPEGVGSRARASRCGRRPRSAPRAPTWRTATRRGMRRLAAPRPAPPRSGRGRCRAARSPTG